MEEMKSRINTSEQMKTAILEGLWLTYFNDTLHARGIITEAEHNKIRILTNKRTIERSR